MLKHITVCFTINFASVPVPLDPSDEQATPKKFYFLYLSKISDYIEARSCNVIAVSQMKSEERSNTEFWLKTSGHGCMQQNIKNRFSMGNKLDIDYFRKII